MSDTRRRWCVREQRDELPAIYHLPDVGLWSVFSAVDVARAVMAALPSQSGPNGPVDAIEPLEVAALPSRSIVVKWRWWSSWAGKWVRSGDSPSSK